MGAGFDATGSYGLVLGTFVMAGLDGGGVDDALGAVSRLEAGVEQWS